MCLYQESMVAFHIFLAVVFMPNNSGCSESDDETNIRYNAKVKHIRMSYCIIFDKKIIYHHNNACLASILGLFTNGFISFTN